MRFAVGCALTTLVVEIYQTPAPALTVYVVFFLMKPDRTESIVISIAFSLLLALVIACLVPISDAVINDAAWPVESMALISFALVFIASTTKLRPVAPIVALIAAYVLDLLAQAHSGELATRVLLYVWLFVGMPAGVSIVVNLLA